MLSSPVFALHVKALKEYVKRVDMYGVCIFSLVKIFKKFTLSKELK